MCYISEDWKNRVEFNGGSLVFSQKLKVNRLRNTLISVVCPDVENFGREDFKDETIRQVILEKKQIEFDDIITMEKTLHLNKQKRESHTKK